MKALPSLQLELLPLCAALLLTACGGDSKAEQDVAAVEQKAEQDFEKTKDAINREGQEAAEGFANVAESTQNEAPAAENVTRAPKEQTPAVEETKPATPPASMSLFQQKLSEQLGQSAANELESAMNDLKRQGNNLMITSAVDGLSSALASGNNPGALDSLTKLTSLSGDGKINPLQLTDVASISSASILKNAFGEGDQPTLIENAIDSYTNSKLLTGSKDLFKAVTGGVDMSASQTSTVNEMLDSLKPLLGTWGDNLDTLRDVGGQTKDAVDAVKNLF